MSQYAYEEKYLNKTCPHCGGNILIINNILEICEKCGYTPPSSNTATMNNKIIADNQKEDVSFGVYGWICPKCGAVMSPYTDVCPNCTKSNFEVTCTATSQVTEQKNFNVQDFIGGRKDKLGYE
jgi:DNA-directed RNA polymerase subunit M/transcription elongation factor TFIIS